jgi:tellurite resistance protein TerC
MRALYVALAQSVATLRYLHWGLAAVLAFAGLKMILAEWVKLPPLVSVGIIIACIGLSVWASLRARAREPERQEPPVGGGREAHA